MKRCYKAFTHVLMTSFLALLLQSQSARAESRLQVTEGTLSLGGNANLVFKADDISKFSAGSLRLNLGVDLGYFVIDGLMLGMNLAGNISFLNSSGDRVGLGPFLTYVFETNTLAYPYLGSSFNITWQQGLLSNEKMPTANSWSFDATPKAGVLLAINKHVALDFGLSAGFIVPLTPKSPIAFNGLAGLFGVKAFF